MNSFPWRVCAFAALLPLSVHARATPADPTNAAASVPATQYESAFKNYRPAVDSSASPDKGWRAANDAVAANPGEGQTETGGSMNMPMPGNPAAAQSTGKTMVMPDGTTMPVDQHPSAPMDKSMKVPSDKGMKMPDGSTMPMPKGDTSMPGMDMSNGHDAKGH